MHSLERITRRNRQTLDFAKAQSATYLDMQTHFAQMACAWMAPTKELLVQLQGLFERTLDLARVQVLEEAKDHFSVAEQYLRIVPRYFDGAIVAACYTEQPHRVFEGVQSGVGSGLAWVCLGSQN